MEYRRDGNSIILKLSRGEEIVSSILGVAMKENIRTGFVSGIGATDEAVVGIYDVNTKVYTKIELSKPMEILSLLGNISVKDGENYTHLHITLASIDNVYGGHLTKAIISGTAEIFINIIDNISVERNFDNSTGLNLMKF
jgi:predicted DNA-binding protein with PD1-like motif